MPGLPNFSVQQLSAEQVEQYEHSQSADIAARYWRRACAYDSRFIFLSLRLCYREIAKALGLAEYQSDAATAVCVDYVSYVLK